MSWIVAPLYFLSRNLTEKIIGAPIALLMPVGSGIQNIINPIFWSFLPGADALCTHPKDLAVDLSSNFDMSVYSESLRLAESENLCSFSSRVFRWSTMTV